MMGRRIVKNILHGVGVPQTVLVAVVEVLHLGERLQAEVEDGQGGAGRLASSGPPHRVGGSGLHHSVDVKGREGGTLLTVYIIISW